MSATTKLSSIIGLLAATTPLFGNASAPANECIIDIDLGSGKDNYVHNTSSSAREIGYWNVDDGGAKADGIELGSAYINLSALSGPMASQDCIEDIRLVAGDWNQDRNPPLGYKEAGWWDMDSGGSVDSSNKSSEHRMTLHELRGLAACVATPSGHFRSCCRSCLTVTATPFQRSRSLMKTRNQTMKVTTSGTPRSGNTDVPAADDIRAPASRPW